jgi:DNA-binding GntR family transcriptional regulator
MLNKAGSSVKSRTPALEKMDLEAASDSAIPRQSLTSAVADKLRDQIIRGEIPEGAQLRQDARLHR